jgi:non-ribosomal peptide synthase protein (TIGR01720 family)
MEIFGLPEVGLDDGFYDLGGDSRSAVHLVARARRAGFDFTVKDLMVCQTIDALAELSPARTATAPASEVHTESTYPLVPLQARFFDSRFDDPTYFDPAHFNLTVPLGVDPGFSFEMFRDSAERVLSRHEALRMRFVQSADGWRQRPAGSAEAWYGEVAIDTRSTGWLREMDHQVDRFHHGFDLATGPLIRFLFLNRGETEPGWLVMDVHHLVCDGISISVLLEELQDEYLARLAGRPSASLPEPCSYLGHLQDLHRQVNSAAAEAISRFWTAQPWSSIAPLPKDKPGGSRQLRYIKQIRASLDQARTQILTTSVARFDCSVEDMLLASLAQSLQEMGWASTFAIDICRHGRDPLASGRDTSRLVGWLNTADPHIISSDGIADGLPMLRSVVSQVRAFRRYETGWSELRYLSRDPELRKRLSAWPRRELYLNYQGRDISGDLMQAPFHPAELPAGQPVTQVGEQPYQIKISAEIRDGRLAFALAFSTEVYEEATIEQLSRALSGNLTRLAALSAQEAAVIR